MSTQVLVGSRTMSANTWSTIGTTNIATPPPLTPSCAPLYFQNAMIDTTSANTLLAYCQKYFTTGINGGATNPNPACIVCVDTRYPYPNGPLGITFSANNYCNQNITPFKSSKLRFLSSKKSTYSRFLQNASNSSNTTAANSTPQVSVYSYNVCPIQDLVCGNDILSSSTSYSQYVSNFWGTINTLAGISAIAPTLTKANFYTTQPPAILVDSAPPVVNLNYTKYSFNTTTGIGFSINIVSYSPTQIFCWWALSPSNTSLTINQIQYANASILNSGNATFTPYGTVINNTNNISLVLNSDYNVWVVCTNNIIGSQQYTNVTSATYFFSTVSGSNNNNPSGGNGSATNGSNGSSGSNGSNGSAGNGSAANASNGTNGSSASFITYGFALLMTLLFIL